MTLPPAWQPSRYLALFIAALLALTGGNGYPDTTIRYVSVDGSGEIIGIQRMHIGAAKMAITQEGSRTTTVFDAKDGRLYTVNREAGEVMEIDPESLADKAEKHIQTRAKVLEGMEARLAKMPKDEREKLQSVMDEIHEVNRKATEEPIETEYTGRPEMGKVGDFEAKVVDAHRGRILTATYYLVKWETLGLEREELDVIEAFQFYLHMLSEKMPTGMRKGLGDYDLLVSGDGELPVEKIKYDREGNTESREILNGVNHDPVDRSLFDLPDEFERVSP